ncbi:LOW QUALITY PROTEIN: long-chain-fatty-acid--CoA ligase ACSBG2-like [Erythrolamprus reginae]|uniref:LOW QUALITY PROTEIN: long-chain-fatty-acid--CoA ligase ACSBG2-like n=1 Tax=Erythrolamprus reginae TaxID=121349 RepID=UPI00396C30E9
MAAAVVSAPIPVGPMTPPFSEPTEVSLNDIMVTPSSPRAKPQQPQQPAEQPEAEMSKGPAVGGLWTTKRDGEVKLRMEPSGIGSETPITVHELFLATVEKYGNFPALASKKQGRWSKLTFRQYYEECRKTAKSFIKLGLGRFNSVCILGFNSLEWFLADIGAIFAGGFAVGIYTTNSPEACHYVAENCEANIIVVENDKQLQKILEVEKKLPHLKAIICYNEDIKEKRPNLYSWKEFMALGSSVPDEQLNKVLASLKPNQCCTIIYTSGTTGNPKGVMLSHDNITWTAKAAGQYVNLKTALDGQESVVSYLPLSHIAAQMIDIWLPVAFGVETYFAQPDALKGTLVDTLREVRPTAFMGVPRVWEKMQERMKSVGAKSSTLKKKIALWAKSVGLETNLKRMNGSPDLPMNYRLARALIYKKIRKALGLDRCNRCYTGAAPITKETLEYFLSLDIVVYELYGMSESSGPHTVSFAASYRMASCYVCLGAGCSDVKASTISVPELIITAGGENIPPVPIEDAVKEAVPILSNVMLVGDKAKYLVMLMTLKSNMNLETGAAEDELTAEAVEFCQKLGSKSTKVSDIVENKDVAVYTAIQKGVMKVNDRATSNAQKIQKWVILNKDFSIQSGELGPTMKLKRPVVVKMYQEHIQQLYAETLNL